MARTTHNIADANKYIDKGQVKTIITFRTQQLYDLWENEMRGQISDGMWENARHTDWLWKNVYVQLGDTTKVEVISSWSIGRKSFGMTGELWDIIGDRIIDENGFANEKEAKKAWREIATAIYNATVTLEAQEIATRLIEEKRSVIRDQMGDLVKEWVDLVGQQDSMKGYYKYASYNFNHRKETYLDGSVHDRSSYLFLHVYTDSQGNLKHQIDYHDAKWYVPVGKLAEAIEAIKEFDKKMLFGSKMLY